MMENPSKTLNYEKAARSDLRLVQCAAGNFKKWHVTTSLHGYAVDLAEDGRRHVRQPVACVGSLARRVDSIVESQLEHLNLCISHFFLEAAVL